MTRHSFAEALPVLEEYAKAIEPTREYVNQSNPDHILEVGLMEEGFELNPILNKPGGVDKDELTHKLGNILWYVSQIGDRFGVSFAQIEQASQDTLSGKHPKGSKEPQQLVYDAIVHTVISFSAKSTGHFDEFGQPATMAGSLNQLVQAIELLANKHGISVEEIAENNKKLLLQERSRPNSIIAMIEAEKKRATE